MTEESKAVMRAGKTANIIMSISDLYHISLQKATDLYYTSSISDLIEEKIADLHCRSDKYLATLVWEDHNN